MTADYGGNAIPAASILYIQRRAHSGPVIRDSVVCSIRDQMSYENCDSH
jgi:hypothetical protein